MRSIAALLVGGSLIITAPGVALSGSADPTPAGDRDHSPRTFREFGSAQTSDGEAGEIAAPMTRRQRGESVPVLNSTWAVSPGVTATVWDETDACGPVRYYVLSVDYTTPGLRLDYASSGVVTKPDTVPNLLAPVPNVVAGVNGDFYDIGDTNAPLGIAKARKGGTISGRIDGWNAAFYFDAANAPRIGTLALQAKIRQLPKLKVSTVNAPFVRQDGIGVYTRRWGPTSGYRVTEQQRALTRMLVIRGGRVVRNTAKLSKNKPITGNLLIGRGKGAKALRKIRVGRRINVKFGLSGAPKMAITGNKYLLQNNKRVVSDDRELHPRTAIGIDRETNQIFIVAVDGRQEHSRGYTMVELAEKMRELGAEDALNLDGGGSTTMSAVDAAGAFGVINQPSDAFLRRVGNGISVAYSGPPAPPVVEPPVVDPPPVVP